FSAGGCAEARQLDLWWRVVHLELAEGLVDLGEALHGLVHLAVNVAAVGLVPVRFVLDLPPPTEIALVRRGQLVATDLRLERGKRCRAAAFTGVVPRSVVGAPLGRAEAWEADGHAVLAVVGTSLGEECRNPAVGGGLL